MRSISEKKKNYPAREWLGPSKRTCFNSSLVCPHYVKRWLIPSEESSNSILGTSLGSTLLQINNFSKELSIKRFSVPNIFGCSPIAA